MRKEHKVALSVLEEMLAICGKTEAKDRQDAMNVMVSLLWYEVSFRLDGQNTFVLFRNGNDLSSFCVDNEVKIPVMKQLIEDMRSEGLIAPEEYPVTLTQLGVEKLCQR